MVSAVLVASLSLLNFSEEGNSAEVETAFDFYLQELVQHEMPADAPMARLIEERLIEAAFDTTSANIFKTRMLRIKRAAEARPDRAARFTRLDPSLAKFFEAKLAEAKEKRMIYTAAGAVVGALVAIPVGKILGSSAKILWLSVPAGALIGAGAGYLLGNLVAMPDYSYRIGSWDFDLYQPEDFFNLRKE